MRRRLLFPDELVLLAVGMAYMVAGPALSVYFYREPMTAGLPVCGALLLLLTAGTAALGYGRRREDWLPWGWRAAAWALLIASSLMLIMEIGYMYAPDGIANTTPLFHRSAYLGVFMAQFGLSLAVLRIYARRWRAQRAEDMRRIPGEWLR
jgi:hypothetical protein